MPTLADLDAAMLRPGRSVPAVNRLGGGTIAMAGSDQPWRVVGRACAVYQLRQPSGRVLALRCPLADARELDPTLGDRYRAFGSDPALARLRAAGGPLVADVTLVPDGLAFPAPDFRSAPHPLMAMEWVMGPTLLAATDRACHRGDRPYLAALADVWAATIGALATAGFSHGDLAADNALVRPAGSGGSGGIALIDYDTCAWRGVPPPRSAAPGPGYAHPSGAVPPLEQRDHFPALVVYASLRVLALWPELREQHGDSPGRTGGVILFGPQDLRDPDASTLFGALRVLDDPAVKQLLAMLREACLAPVTATPPLTQVVARVRDADARRRIDQGGLGDAAPGGSAGTRLAAAPRPTEGGRGSRHPTLAPLSTSAVPTPPAAPLAPPVGQDARERQRRLTRLNSLLLAGDEEGAQRFWSESGLESDPDAVRELGPRMAELGRRRLLRLAREAA